MKQKYKILIVEDEILIADTIETYLLSANFDIAGKAISYDEAVGIIKINSPDLILLDIRLNGLKTGIDLGQYLSKLDERIPHIYLSSQTDKPYLEKAKKSLPEAFLTKPIQKASLLNTIEVVFHRGKQLVEKLEGFIKIKDHEFTRNIPLKDILFVSAEHVYLRIHLKGGKNIVTRNSLKWILDQLPSSDFIQVHRSYVINVNYVSDWTSNLLTIYENKIPISRARKKETFVKLKK